MTSTLAPPSRSMPTDCRYFWFHRGDQTFGLPMHDLFDVRGFMAVGAPPQDHPAVLGCVQHRDNTLPVLDPLVLLGRPSAPLEKPAMLAIIGLDGQPIASLAINRVGNIMHVAQLDEPTPQQSEAPFLGSHVVEGTRIQVLSIDAIARMLNLPPRPMSI